MNPRLIGILVAMLVVGTTFSIGIHMFLYQWGIFGIPSNPEITRSESNIDPARYAYTVHEVKAKAGDYDVIKTNKIIGKIVEVDRVSNSITLESGKEIGGFGNDFDLGDVVQIEIMKGIPKCYVTEMTVEPEYGTMDRYMKYVVFKENVEVKNWLALYNYVNKTLGNVGSLGYTGDEDPYKRAIAENCPEVTSTSVVLHSATTVKEPKN